MAEGAQISEFGKILIFLITGIVMVCLTFFINRLIAPKKPNPEKLTSYECGEEPTGNAWLPFNSRFYVIALIFLLFDVEMVFVFPWAIVFGNREMNATVPAWGKLALIEMFLFLGVLMLGLVYVWVKGDLDWIKPRPVLPITDVKVPKSLYDALNIEQGSYAVRPFTIETAPLATTAIASATTKIEAQPALKKPAFKPMFKKPENE